MFALGLPSKHVPHVLFGVLGAWIYLRYYQRKGEVVGDLSSSFAFATFWPEYVYRLEVRDCDGFHIVLIIDAGLSKIYLSAQGLRIAHHKGCSARLMCA